MHDPHTRMAPHTHVRLDRTYLRYLLLARRRGVATAYVRDGRLECFYGKQLRGVGECHAGVVGVAVHGVQGADEDGLASTRRLGAVGDKSKESFHPTHTHTHTHLSRKKSLSTHIHTSSLSLSLTHTLTHIHTHTPVQEAILEQHR
jgi:hypothetical protein